MTTPTPEAIEAAIRHLANTARDDDGWLSDLQVRRPRIENGGDAVHVWEEGNIDVHQAVEEALTAALPFLEAQLRADHLELIERLLEWCDPKNARSFTPENRLAEIEDQLRNAAMIAEGKAS